MSLGYFAPLPPARSGVADYAAAMLRALEAHRAIKVNAAGDINLYHVGNNRLHAEIYKRCLRAPGVVILHDPLLQHLMQGSLTEQEYIEEFVYNYGEWNRALAQQLWTRRGAAMGDPAYYRYPMLSRLLERSLAVVVHSESARQVVHTARQAGKRTAPVHVLPHLALDRPQPLHWEDTTLSYARDRVRREELGVQTTECLLGIFGYLRESKRLLALLRVAELLRGEGIPLRLLVAGDFASEDYERSIQPLIARKSWVIRRQRCDAATFRRLLQAVDICVNLRYPSAGESSGIAARALALGTTLVASEASGDAGLPAGCVAPVATGPAEETSLAETLRWLSRDASARRHIAQRGQQWCREHMDPDAIVRRLLVIATEALSEVRAEGAESPLC